MIWNKKKTKQIPSTIDNKNAYNRYMQKRMQNISAFFFCSKFENIDILYLILPFMHRYLISYTNKLSPNFAEQTNAVHPHDTLRASLGATETSTNAQFTAILSRFVADIGEWARSTEERDERLSPEGAEAMNVGW